MPLWFFPALLGLSAIVTMVCGIWLLLHLTALAHVFAGKADIVRPRVLPRASRRTVKRVLGGFLGGGAVSMATLAVVVSGLASALTA